MCPALARRSNPASSRATEQQRRGRRSHCQYRTTRSHEAAHASHARAITNAGPGPRVAKHLLVAASTHLMLGAGYCSTGNGHGLEEAVASRSHRSCKQDRGASFARRSGRRRYLTEMCYDGSSSGSKRSNSLASGRRSRSRSIKPGANRAGQASSRSSAPRPHPGKGELTPTIKVKRVPRCVSGPLRPRARAGQCTRQRFVSGSVLSRTRSAGFSRRRWSGAAIASRP
jgi:hypothetical protein